MISMIHPGFLNPSGSCPLRVFLFLAFAKALSASYCLDSMSKLHIRAIHSLNICAANVAAYVSSSVACKSPLATNLALNERK